MTDGFTICNDPDYLEPYQFPEGNVGSLPQVDKLYCGDAAAILKTWPDNFAQMCLTSPPYMGLRDYFVEGQIGRERDLDEYIAKLVTVFKEIKRVLKDDGTCWIVIGDSFCGTGDKGEYQDPKYKDGRNGQSISLTKKMEGLKSKDLIGVPWELAFALRDDGWYLRSGIIYYKPNCMPDPVKDRPTQAHEYVFLLSKSKKYYYNHEAIKEPSVSDHPSGNAYKRDVCLTYKDRNGPRGSDQQWQPTALRNSRSVWMINTEPLRGYKHSASFPTELARRCISAGSLEGSVVCDPFVGSGTTALVAKRLGRHYIGIDINKDYIEMSNSRINNGG